MGSAFFKPLLGGLISDEDLCRRMVCIRRRGGVVNRVASAGVHLAENDGVH